MDHPLLRALLGPWEWRPAVLLVLLPLIAIYLVGWARLRRRGATRLASKWRLAAYLGGMLLLSVSLMSPVDILGGQLFFMHMTQHLLSIMLAAPLIWLGSPFPIGVWGLPIQARRFLIAVFADSSPVRPYIALATQPFVAWMLFVFIYIGWHDAGAYNLALVSGRVHDVQHITFFGAAMLFWWHIVGAAPRLHKSLSAWVAIFMLMATIPFNAITGFVIANSESVIYTYYESVPRIWGFSVLQDQSIGGVIMWIPGSQMFFMAAGVVLGVMFWRDRRKRLAAELPDIPPSGALDVADEALIAPGLEQRLRHEQWRDMAAQRTSHTTTP
jgi:cytochrome c oxidase assembly factor CtaG